MVRGVLLRRVLQKIYNSFKFIKIVTVHHVTDEEPIIDSCIISTQAFEKYIEKKHFVHVYEGLTKVSKNQQAYILTVDDALDDLYTEIWPICKKRNIPFTAFISADLLDEKGYITKEQLVEMSRDPLVTIGSHGCNHVKLNECKDDSAWYEISESKKKLENLIRKKVDLLSYPNGIASRREKIIAKKVGYKYAFGTIPRQFNFLTRMVFPFDIPRYNLSKENPNP